MCLLSGIIGFVVLGLLCILQSRRMDARNVRIGVFIHKDHENADRLFTTVRFKTRKIEDAIDETRGVLVKPFEETKMPFDLNDCAKLREEVCAQTAEKIIALVVIGTKTSSEFLSSLSQKMHIPVFMPLATTPLSRKSDYIITMRPSFTEAIIHLIRFYNWDKVYYLFDSDEGLQRLDEFYTKIHAILGINKLTIRSRRITNISDSYALLRAVDRIDGNCTNLPYCSCPFECPCPKHIILDLSSVKAFNLTREQIINVGMNRDSYHYILANLGIDELDLSPFLYGGVNITGFTVVDKRCTEVSSRDCNIFNTDICPIKYEQALLMDTMEFLVEAVNKQAFKRIVPRSLPCGDRQSVWDHGETFLDIIRQTRVDRNRNTCTGTGTLSIDRNLTRKEYILNVHRFEYNTPLRKIGIWQPGGGLQTNITTPKPPKVTTKNETTVYTIVTIEGEPFVQEIVSKETSAATNQGVTKIGDKLYEGYCIDVAEKVKQRYEKMNGEGTFNYKFKLVDDNQFGKADKDNGTWNGMIGELLAKKADMAIASLTINRDRQRVVDFTKPFMKIGISIMIKKPEKQKPGVFSFMQPLDTKVWLCVMVAFTGVSLVLFFVGRWSPYEWQSDTSQKEGSVTNAFTLSNTLWFSLGALMQQGSDIFPRSISGRIVGSAWWFFTLILISSYTANLAAFLTIERLVTQIKNVDDLVNQNEISYGTYSGGSTESFFEMSQVPVYRRMHEYMKANEDRVMVKNDEEGFRRVRAMKGKYAYLVESPKNDYQNQKKPCNTMKVGENLDHKGYGIATPPESSLRKELNLVVLKLREEGELYKLERKWWYDKGECGAVDSKDTSKNPLTLSNVSGIFHILIGGLVLSMLVSLLEYSFHRFRKQTKAKSKKDITTRPSVKIEKKNPLEVLRAAGYSNICRDDNAYTFNPPEQLTTFDGGNHTSI